MKKILFILLTLSLLAVQSAKAQVGATTMTPTKNVHTNADTSEHKLTVTANFSAFAIQAIGTKTSGTPAGRAIPRGSLDNVNWVNLSTDTLTIANQATNTKVWTFTTTPYLYYEVYVITSGTTVMNWSALALQKK